MIKLSKRNLITLNKEELLEITKQELQEYKEARKYNQVSSNIPRIKNLEALDKRLGYFAIADSEVHEVRVEVKKLLNEDVYKKTELPKATTHFSSYEDYLKARLRSK